MGMFSKIKDAKFSEGGVYIKQGVYRLQIEAVKAILTRQKKQAFVVEVKVLESNNPERAAGSLCTYMVTMDKEPALGNVKQFLETIMKPEQLDFSKLSEEQCDAVCEGVCAEKNPLRGRIVRASCVDIKTKAGRDFTKVKFLTDDMSATDIAKQHAEDLSSAK